MNASAAPPVRRPRPPAAVRRAARRGVRGKPTAAMLTAVGDPPDGTPLTAAEYAGRTLEFHAELVDGRLDYLPMARSLHSRIVRYLFRLLDGLLAEEYPAAALDCQHVRLRVAPRRAREADFAVLLAGEADPRHGSDPWAGADFAAEVVSPDDPDRDYDDKRADYAAAGVTEYWIVDPRERTPEDDRGRSIRVLTLDGGAYRETGYREGETARSELLDGLTVDVSACLAGA